MVTTVFKEKESKKLEIDKVAIKETIDLEKNIKASYFWIGRVPGKIDDFRVQLDDDLINDYSEIKGYLIELRKNPEYSQVWGSRFFNVFKVDKKTEMIIVRKVHNELKEAEAFKVVYSVNRENKSFFQNIFLIIKNVSIPKPIGDHYIIRKIFKIIFRN